MNLEKINAPILLLTVGPSLSSKPFKRDATQEIGKKDPKRTKRLLLGVHRFSEKGSRYALRVPRQLSQLVLRAIGFGILSDPMAVYAQSDGGANHRVNNRTGKGYDVTQASEPTDVVHTVKSQGEVFLSGNPPASEMKSWIWPSTNRSPIWSAPVSVNHETTLSMTYMAVGSDFAANYAWMGNLHGNPDHDLFFTRSTDDGKTWSANQGIIPVDSREPNQVSSMLVIDSCSGQRNHFFVAMRIYDVGAGRIHVNRFADDGASWTALAKVAYTDLSIASILKVSSLPALIDPDNLPVRMKDWVDHAISLEVLPHPSSVEDDEMSVAWTDYGATPYKDQARANQSSDGGAHWGEITDPSDALNNGSLNHYAVDPVVQQGLVQVVWLDQRVTNWIYPYTAAFGEPVEEHTINIACLQS